VETSGIIFLDEIDKIAGAIGHGPDVSREGVQRDILPIAKGIPPIPATDSFARINLFIAAGGISVSKPSDLFRNCKDAFPFRRAEVAHCGDFIRISRSRRCAGQAYTALLQNEASS